MSTPEKPTRLELEGFCTRLVEAKGDANALRFGNEFGTAGIIEAIKLPPAASRIGALPKCHGVADGAPQYRRNNAILITPL